SLKMGASDYVIKTNLSRLPSAVARVMEQVEERDARRRIENELHEVNQMFRAFMENMPGAAFIKDGEGRFVYANHGLDKALNVEQGGAVGRLDTELLPLEYAYSLRELDRQVLQAGEARQEIENFPSASGELRYWLSTKFPLVDAKSRKPQVGGIAIDITERMRAEQELWLRTRAIEACVNPIVIVDVEAPGMPLIYVNGAFETITGYPGEEAIGRNCNFLQGNDTDQPELEKLRAAIHERRPASVMLRNYRKDGTM